MSFKPQPHGARSAFPLTDLARQLAAGVGLAGCMIVASAGNAQAGSLPGLAGGPCRAMASAAPLAASPCRMASLDRGASAQRPSDIVPGAGVRLVLTADRGAAAVVLGAGPDADHSNPFTLVGNRTGLETAARTEIRDGETWLVAAEAEPRAVGLAALQEGASSVALQ